MNDINQLSTLYSNAIARAEKAEEALRKSEWQPIETAPKDGTEILLYREDCGVILGRWIACCDFITTGDPNGHFCDSGDDDGWEEPDWFGADFVSGYRISNDGDPTHWQPLPSPPPPVRETP